MDPRKRKVDIVFHPSHAHCGVRVFHIQRHPYRTHTQRMRSAMMLLPLANLVSERKGVLRLWTRERKIIFLSIHNMHIVEVHYLVHV